MKSYFGRRVAMLVGIAFGLTVAVPGVVPNDTGFPVSWLYNWLAHRSAWAADAAAFAGVPIQAKGWPVHSGHYVSASETRAGGGSGRAPEHVLGGLKPYAPHEPNLQSGAAGHSTRGFDAATSRRERAGGNATTEVFANADGTVTQRINGGRVNYRAADGNWYPIETRLIRGADGRLHMGTNEIEVSFAGELGTDVVTRATASQIAGASARLALMRLPTGQALGYDLAGASGVTPSFADSTATYANILPDTDLELVTTDSGFKETLILKSPNASNQWVFPLQLEGLTPRMTGTGDVELIDTQGVVRVWLPVGFMQDSRVDRKHGGATESTNMVYELIVQDGKPALRVTADAAWLRDPARVYPVRVDPTATTWTTGDVFVDNNPTGPDHNGDNLPVGTWDSGATKHRSFIHLDNFDDDGFVGRRITAANLKAYLTWAYSCSTYRPVYVHAATEPWTVAGLDAGSYPGPAISAPIGSLTITDHSPACTNTGGNRGIGQWHSVPLDVATFDSWAKGGANLGLALTASETDNYAWKRFTSANYGSGQYKPYLELTYSANVPAQLDSRFPANNFVATSLTPQLVARAHDPDGWPNLGLQYKFRVYDDTGATLVAESGWGGAAWMVPAGLLSWGKTYLYNVQVYDKATYSAVYPQRNCKVMVDVVM